MSCLVYESVCPCTECCDGARSVQEIPERWLGNLSFVGASFEYSIVETMDGNTANAL